MLKKQPILLFSLITSFIFLLSANVALAQQNLSNSHEKQIKRGLDRIKNKLDPLLEKKDIFLQQELPASKKTSVDEESHCFDITKIDIEGVAAFTDDELTAIKKPYLKQCLTLGLINQLVEQISTLYLQQGFVTSRAYIKPQDLSKGILSLFVLEGYIQSIVANPQELTGQQLSLAFPTSTGKLLNLRDLEQGLENVNRLGQNQATMALSPGDSQGSSVVVVNNSLSSHWQGSIGINNTGVESTGVYLLDAYVTADNLFGINDNLVASFSSNIGAHDLPQASSRSYSLVGSIPYGYWLLSLNGSYFDYEQTVLGSSVDFLTHGSSFNTSLKLDHTFYRGAQEKLNFALAFTKKDSRNYIEDVFLDTSSRTIYVWNLSTHYLHHFNFGSINFRASVDKSVPWFGAKEKLVSAEDDFQFTKYQFDIQLSTAFEWWQQDVFFSSNFHLLYSSKEILASEGISIGGRYSVRGIARDSLFGYRGAYLRNDFTLPIENDWPVLNRFNVFIGLDIGISNLPEYPDKSEEWLAGSIIGVQTSYQNFNFSLSYAKALRVPEILNAQEHEFDFSVRINF